MQPVISDFLAWFGRFVMVASVFIIATHLLARSLRKRKAARTPRGPAAGGMTRNAAEQVPQ